MTGHTGNTRVVAGVATACVAQFVVLLDATIVTTTLPSIRSGLRLTGAELAWVPNAYNLAFGGLLIVGGRATDRFGARRLFAAGLAAFVAGSLVCALAPLPAVLIAGRLLQGGGAAALAPAALAALTAVTPPGRVRQRAIGWWTAAAATGAASGWVLGGVAAQLAGWRSVFWVNVPLGVLGLVALTRALPRSPGSGTGGVALAGGLLGTTAIGAGLLALSDLGGAAPWLVLAAGAAAALVVHERVAASPLLPRGLLRRTGVVGGDLVTLLLNATITPVMYLAVLLVQQRLGLPPATAGLLFPVFNGAIIVASLCAPALLRRVGARPMVAAGFLAVTAGAALALATRDPAVAVAALLGTFCVMGTGSGTASVAATQVATEAVPEAQHGAASALVSVSAQVGAAVGLAAITPLATASAARFDPTAGFVVVAVVAAASTGCALLLPRPRPASARGRGADLQPTD